MQFDHHESPNRAIYIPIKAGTIAEMSAELYSTLSAQGYALLVDEIQSALLDEVKYYASRCAVLEFQREAQQSFVLDATVTLSGDEWAIVEPCVRAHCDLKQARLMEGSASLSGATFLLSVSEATTLYNEKRLDLFQNAFIEPPFSFPTLFEGGK